MTISKQQPSSALLCILLAGPLLLSSSFISNTQVEAQLNLEFGGIEINIGGENGSTIDLGNLDLSTIIEDASEFIGESFENLDLPAEIEDIITLPNFENFTFSFGGNCTFCFNDAIDETLELEGVPCSDWAIVSALGVPETSSQCTLLRAKAVESCGCPMPEENQGRTCNVCQEGEEIGTSQGTFPDTIGITCEDLVDLPAVDGDFTCGAVLGFQEQCQCQSTGEGTSASEESAASDESSACASGRGIVQRMILAVTALLSASAVI